MDPVILPKIRQIMPNIIAQDIIGVQPMTATAAQIHTIKTRYDSPSLYNVALTKVHFKHFLRVYNRKKYHNFDDIAALGYATVNINIFNTVSAKQWCRETLKPGSFIFFKDHSCYRLCFAYEQDYTLFLLRWG